MNQTNLHMKIHKNVHLDYLNDHLIVQMNICMDAHIYSFLDIHKNIHVAHINVHINVHKNVCLNVYM